MRRSSEGWMDSTASRLSEYRGRGVVTTATCEAWVLGLHSGMGLMKDGSWHRQRSSCRPTLMGIDRTDRYCPHQPFGETCSGWLHQMAHGRDDSPVETDPRMRGMPGASWTWSRRSVARAAGDWAADDLQTGIGRITRCHEAFPAHARGVTRPASSRPGRTGCRTPVQGSPFPHRR